MNWCGCVLFPAKHVGKRHNLTSTIKSRIAALMSQSVPPEPEYSHAAVSRRADSRAQLARTVSAILEDGNLRAAVCIICSDDVPAMPSAAGLAKLQGKHPPASLKPCDLTDSSDFMPLEAQEQGVHKALQSFPPGSAGGTYGLRPQ